MNIDRYYDEMSRGDCEVVTLNLDTGEEKMILPRKEGETAQKVRGISDGYIEISTDGQEGEKFIRLDADGQGGKETEFFMEGKRFLYGVLMKFHKIPDVKVNKKQIVFQESYY